MKTKFMAAVAACRLKARAFARACLESKRNPYRLFRPAAAIAVAVVIVPATILLGDGAFADGENYNNSGTWDEGQGLLSELPGIPQGFGLPACLVGQYTACVDGSCRWQHLWGEEPLLGIWRYKGEH